MLRAPRRGRPSLLLSRPSRIRQAWLARRTPQRGHGPRELFGDVQVAAAPALAVRQVFARFWPYTKPYRRWLFGSLVFVAITPALDALSIWMFKVLIDDVLTPRDFGPFPWVAGAYIAITVVAGGVSFVDRYLSVWVGERFLTDLRTTVFRHMQGLSLDFFDRQRLGDILSRLTGDIAAIEAVVLSGVTRALSYGVRILLFGGALFYLEWQLACLALVVAPLFWAMSRVFARRLKEASRENRRTTGAMTSVAEESLANVALVQAYNRQDSEVERFRQRNLAVLASQLRSTRLRGLYTPIGDLFELVGLLLVIGIGTWKLTRDELTLGELLVFMAYFGQLASPLRGVGRLSNSMFSAAASAERILEVLAVRPAVPERTGGHTATHCGGAVSLEGVHFSYPGSDAESLRGVSLSIAPGQTVAVVGGSGAGKSTVAKLLLRFYDATEGAVRVDGHDLRDWDLHSLRQNVAVVMQETMIFDGTIRDNILWSRPEATASELESAIRAADVDRVVERLPEGLDTRVGQRGRRLSGGERQRVAIARAMLRDAPILILDEPTTGLDAESSDRVLAPLRRLMDGRTTIMITHNLASTRDADLVVVLDDGRIAEQGSPAELLAADGLFTRLYQGQGSAGAPVPARRWWSGDGSADSHRPAPSTANVASNGHAVSSSIPASTGPAAPKSGAPSRWWSAPAQQLSDAAEARYREWWRQESWWS